MLRWDYGKLYKEIRKSKGLTQEDICANVFARSTLTRIESGTVIPKFDTMIFLLNQIDMTLEEFEYICNLYYPNERQKILNNVSHINSIVPISQLEALELQCSDYLKNHHDLPIENLSNSLLANILLRKFGDFGQHAELDHITTKVWNYLEKQDTWYYGDLRLLSNILYYFPLEQVKKVTQRILDSLEKYSDYKNIKLHQFTILMNLSTIFLYHKHIKESQAIVLWALDTAKEIKRFDFLGCAQVRLGICQKDEELIDKGLTLLKLTEEDDLVAMLEKEVEQFYRQK
ncbi:helix-turn-helix domain-containing protein [Streptococcus hillyeri]|uniref:Rgg/GadR/MutR family transcriptional regulator n=1 Tax=Streptococcus hillyeri TaxID=2282420 RepID=A0A3L9DNN2_9STRE|nr:Rgg/GadR/MutR family transcriptional regulator [Streptococcus hillyeri]RLY01727.1 Rgg/GadR/MutR family transcriptional regulator [Streptococcus hillyeri]